MDGTTRLYPTLQLVYVYAGNEVVAHFSDDVRPNKSANLILAA